MRRLPDVTSTELAVLKALWGRGDSTIRELTDLLYPDGGPAHYATVQKLLERLAAKRCVRSRQRDRVNVYRATIRREQLIARRLQDTADQLCAGSLAPLLTHLAGAADLGEEELEALRELVEKEGRSR